MCINLLLHKAPVLFTAVEKLQWPRTRCRKLCVDSLIKTACRRTHKKKCLGIVLVRFMKLCVRLILFCHGRDGHACKSFNSNHTVINDLWFCVTVPPSSAVKNNKTAHLWAVFKDLQSEEMTLLQSRLCFKQTAHLIVSSLLFIVVSTFYSYIWPFSSVIVYKYTCMSG